MAFDDGEEGGGGIPMFEVLRTEMELHEAARTGNVELVDLLIRRGVNVNAMNEKDRTALHLSAGQGHVEVVKSLIDADAKVDAEDKFGMNALLWAAWFGQEEALHALVVGGARIKCENKQGLGLIHCGALRGHLNVVKYVVEQLMEDEPMNPDSIIKLDDKEEKGGRTPLHLAAEHGKSEVLEYLLGAGADKDALSTDGSSALHFAAKGGHEDCVTLLIKNGADIDERDNEGRTALHVGAEEGHPHIVELLIRSNAEINAETSKEMSPIHLAANNGHTTVIKVLILHGCDIDTSNNQNNTALHMAALANQPEVVQQLVDAGCDVNVCNARNQTALHIATETGLTSVVESLLIGGANVHVRDKTGRTALHMAARGELVTITDMIIKADRYFCQKQLRNEEFRRGEEKIQFRKDQSDENAQMRPILWRLGTKQLRKEEWKKLAFVWGFTDAHIKAIEHQFTGDKSWKEHGYRLLLIWLHGCDENPVKGLYEGLVGMGRKDLADQIRRRINAKADGHNGMCCIT
ncbi:uncharacterized protein LOC100372378 [Saccoglossus kowalevskii]